MCDYSLEGFQSRKAEVGDKLIIAHVHGFQRVEDAARFSRSRSTNDLCLTCLYEDGIVLRLSDGREAVYKRINDHGYRDALMIGDRRVMVVQLPAGTTAEVVSIPSQKTLDQKLGIDKLNATITQDKDPAGVPKTTEAPGLVQRMVSAVTGRSA